MFLLFPDHFSGRDQGDVFTAIQKTNLLLGKLVKRVSLLEKKKGAKTSTSDRSSFAKKNADVPLAVRVSAFSLYCPLQIYVSTRNNLYLEGNQENL